MSSVDRLVLLEVYAAGEAPIPGADGHGLAQGIRERGRVNPVYANDPAEALEILAEVVRDDDLLLIQGAGNVSEITARLQSINEG